MTFKWNFIHIFVCADGNDEQECGMQHNKKLKCSLSNRDDDSPLL